MSSKKQKEGHRDTNPMTLSTKENSLKRNTAFQVSNVKISNVKMNCLKEMSSLQNTAYKSRKTIMRNTAANMIIIAHNAKKSQEKMDNVKCQTVRNPEMMMPRGKQGPRSPKFQRMIREFNRSQRPIQIDQYPLLTSRRQLDRTMHLQNHTITSE